MGYRSEWKIVINTHNKTKEVINWFHKESQMGTEVANLIDEIIRHAVISTDDNVIELGDDGWKLYHWDELLSLLHDKWDDDPEVDFASIRIGEDYDDHEINQGNHTYVYMCRSIGDADCDTVPAAEAKDTSGNGTQDVGRPVEEQCGQCGKNKDAGTKCWWCGS